MKRIQHRIVRGLNDNTASYILVNTSYLYYIGVAKMIEFDMLQGFITLVTMFSVFSLAAMLITGAHRQ